MNLKTILFRYEPPCYKKCQPTDTKRHCQVEIATQNESAIVVINEAEDRQGSKARSCLGHIAFNVHKDQLRSPNFVYWDRTKFYYQLRLLGRKVLFPIFLYRSTPIQLNSIVIPFPVRITR